MLEALFKFPIIQLDGFNEREKDKLKQLLAKDDADDFEFFDLEAEVPYWDFLNVMDVLLPTDESREDARSGIFSNCQVTFINSGSYIVPWTKEKFKRELEAFGKVQREREEAEKRASEQPKDAIIVKIPRKQITNE